MPGVDHTSNHVLITGASRGLGLAFTRHYLAEGKRVIAGVRAPGKATELSSLAVEYGKLLEILPLDVADEQSISNLSARLVERDVLFELVINNAGVSHDEPFGEWSADSFADHFRVNTIGPVLVSQAVAPLLTEGAALVNLSTGMASLEWNQQPEGALDAYAASKAALNLLTRRLAAKLASRSITVVAISPGWVRTDMGGPAAPAAPEDAVASMAVAIEQLTPQQSGGFLDERGNRIPW